MVNASIKYVIFVGIILILFFVFGLVLLNIDFWLTNIYWLILLGLFVFLVWKYDFIIQMLDYQRAVIFRFGKINRVGGPGWVFVWPVIESFSLVDLRTKTIDVDRQDVVTKDGIKINVDAVIYLKVKKDKQSVVNSIIEVEDYFTASQLFVVSTLRDVIGAMVLGEVISHIDIINAQMKENLEKISNKWGIDIESVEITDIQIPKTVLDAMHGEKAAVQQKLARIERAQAHKAEIEAVKEAARDLDDKALAYYYIRAIEEMSKGKGSKVFFPAEFSNIAKVFSVKGTNPDEYKKILLDYIDDAVIKSKTINSPKTSSTKNSPVKKSPSKNSLVKTSATKNSSTKTSPIKNRKSKKSSVKKSRVKKVVKKKVSKPVKKNS